MKVLLFACCLILVLLNAVSANADLRPPVKTEDPKISKPAPNQQPKYILHTGLEITTDPKAYEARLQIPQSQLEHFRAALDGAPTNPSVVAGIALSSTRTSSPGF
jgi:hypothetical protein